MIGNKLQENENIKPNSLEMRKLKETFPQYFNNKSEFEIDKFKDFLKQEEVEISKEGYELKFLGKSYAKYLSSLETETYISPDIKHNSKEENKDSENLYIVGDNIDALKHLLSSSVGKIKCIYIDPPYNTGSDGFVYPDNFQFKAEELVEKIGITEEEAGRILDLAGKSTHSAWLTFMYPRLSIARELLSEDGAILISIDNNEQSNLRILCDEIFGEENFVETIIWDKKAAAKGVPPQNMIVNVHEYILVYQKSAKFKFSGELRTEEDGFKNPDNDPRGPWRESNIKSTTKSIDDAFTITNPDTGKEYTNTWAFSKESLQQMITEGRILWKETLPKQKEYLYEMTNESKAIKSNWGIFDPQSTTVHLKKLVPEVQFDNPKPLGLLEYLVTVTMEDNDTILDFFSGSSTTAEAIMNVNAKDSGSRNYIMVQIPEKISENKKGQDKSVSTISQYGITRIKRSSALIKDINPNIDLGFKLYYLETPEEKTLMDLENFQPEIKLITDDMISVFDNEHSLGKESILATWINEDGYGLTRTSIPYKLENYQANLIDKSLYIVDEGLDNEDVMTLIKRIEDETLDITRVVVYVHSVRFNVLQELRKNLKVLRNNKNVSLIERF